MKVLYIDAFSGISGDMTAAALLSLGLSLDHLKAQLALLPLHDYSITVETRLVNGIAATKFNVDVVAHGHGHRAYRDIRAMLETSLLDPAVKRLALSIFGKLAEAEGRVHDSDAEAVEFHEVGAVDSIVDIVAAAVGFTALDIEAAYVSTLPLGSGIVPSQHGPLPVPAPATVELLRGFATRAGDGVGELVTPTGAAIVAALARSGPPPDLRVERVGYGAGERRLADRPNVLRLVTGECAPAVARDDVVVIETNVDDFNPELYDYVIERLFAAGARDVFLTPVHMKKNRPGVVLSVIGTESQRDTLASIILTETSAIGVRFYPAHRLILQRAIREVSTPYGPIRVKAATAPNGDETAAPEYEDCKRAAAERGVPIKRVYQAALVAAGSSRPNQ
jgi:hypothetical protein